MRRAGDESHRYYHPQHPFYPGVPATLPLPLISSSSRGGMSDTKEGTGFASHLSGSSRSSRHSSLERGGSARGAYGRAISQSHFQEAHAPTPEILDQRERGLYKEGCEPYRRMLDQRERRSYLSPSQPVSQTRDPLYGNEGKRVVRTYDKCELLGGANSHSEYTQRNSHEVNLVHFPRRVGTSDRFLTFDEPLLRSRSSASPNPLEMETYLDEILSTDSLSPNPQDLTASEVSALSSVSRGDSSLLASTSSLMETHASKVVPIRGSGAPSADSERSNNAYKVVSIEGNETPFVGSQERKMVTKKARKVPVSQANRDSRRPQEEGQPSKRKKMAQNIKANKSRSYARAAQGISLKVRSCSEDALDAEDLDILINGIDDAIIGFEGPADMVPTIFVTKLVGDTVKIACSVNTVSWAKEVIKNIPGKNGVGYYALSPGDALPYKRFSILERRNREPEKILELLLKCNSGLIKGKLRIASTQVTPDGLVIKIDAEQEMVEEIERMDFRPHCGHSTILLKPLYSTAAFPEVGK